MKNGGIVGNCSMKILLVSATSLEIESIKQDLLAPFRGTEVDLLISGVGSVHTCFNLLKRLGKDKPDLVIGAGVGGFFSIQQPLGQVFKIRSEVFADLGVQESKGWADIFDLGLQDGNTFPYQKGRLVNPDQWPEVDLPVADGCTVNEITTNPGKIDQIIKNYGAQIESMEGAALHYVCLQEKVPFLHLRAVSNTVGERDKQRWKMQEAIRNLGVAVVRSIKTVSAAETKNNRS